jgi:hypothetical protein
MTPYAYTIFPGLTMKQVLAKLSDPEESAYALACLKMQVLHAYSACTPAHLKECCNGEHEFDQTHLDRYLATRPAIPLQAGEFYLDRTGRRHGPLIASPLQHLDYPFRDASSNISWMASGHWYDPAVQKPRDLVEGTG